MNIEKNERMHWLQGGKMGAASSATLRAVGALSSWNAIVRAPRLLLIDNLSAFQWLEHDHKRQRLEPSGTVRWLISDASWRGSKGTYRAAWPQG